MKSTSFVMGHQPSGTLLNTAGTKGSAACFLQLSGTFTADEVIKEAQLTLILCEIWWQYKMQKLSAGDPTVHDGH